ncbi:MAG: TfoX/Sxy family protein [Myxococcales bacterium]|nr:TfoX/Sxy family protein [Myxococcales bacterium]
MAWVKIPKEHHPLFHAALPRDRRVSTLNMFGGVAAKVNGQMFGGLFARSAIVKLSPTDQQEALALDGAQYFDPMGNGRIMRDTVQLPDSIMDEPDELRRWLQRALDYTVTLPPKKPPGAKKPDAKKPDAKKRAPRKPAVKQPAAKQSAAKQPAKQPAKQRSPITR